MLGSNGEIIVGSSDGKVYALLGDGSLVWRYITGAANGDVVSCRGSLVVASKNKFIYGLRQTDGAFLWKYKMERGSTSAPLCVDNGDSTVNVYVGSNDNYIYALRHDF